MTPHEGNLMSLLTGGRQLKQRVQHPKGHERKDRGTTYWFFRYREDKILPDGSITTSRKFHIIAPSRGEGAITKKQAEIKRDEYLVGLNAAPTRAEAAVAAKVPDPAAEPDQIIFGRF